jgi:hypothetical protein
MKRFAISTALMAATVMGAGYASAQTELKDVTRVRDGIVYVGMAYELSEQCSDLSARLFRGLSFLQSLKDHARQLGYSDAEIDAYIDDNAEKDRLETIARAQLVRLGVVEGNEDTYCAVGRQQIEANTRVGWLLR